MVKANEMRLAAATGGRRKGNERGQSLILAIIVMFLLAFLAVVFVVLVARNQGRAGRSRDVLAAQYLAEAGINYADRMLTTSEKGADWRPDPDSLGFDPSGAALPNLANIAKNHPDFKWLRPYSPVEETVEGVDGAKGPTGGFTSFTMGQGRYLLRVSYNPEPSDPMSKFIRVESVGRIGVVDEQDPTTWGGGESLRRELTAYKPIGVTDYLRFVTNREKRSADISLGASGFAVRFGSENEWGEPRGGPIRVNGNLVWQGKLVDIILRGRTYKSDPNGASTAELPLDQVEVAGEIKHEETKDAQGAVQPIPVNVREIIDGGASVSYPVFPSDYQGMKFTTASGFYRDGSDDTDAERHARGIKRLNPPLIDGKTSNNVPRYVTLTRDSGVWIYNSDQGRWVNSGRYGWGRGVYIDNRDDRQPESETIFGGYTPRGDWMKPNNNMSSYWQGPYYVPPGVIIVLHAYDTDGDGQADITITRTDQKTRLRDPEYGRKAVWYDAAGNPMYNKGSTMTIPYPEGVQEFTYVDGGTEKRISIERNGVIYAEGNIRIRGMLAPGKQLTVVSGGIIYIEGSILKYRDPGNPNVKEGDPTCAIALLAKDHVCVNTTQFVSLLTSLGPASIGSDSGTGEPPYHLIVTPEPAASFLSEFSFGPPTGAWQPGDTAAVFVRHAGHYGPSYINMWLNRSGAGAAAGLCEIGVPALLGPYVYGCGDPRFPGADEGTGISSLFEHRIWELTDRFTGGNLRTAIGVPNQFEIALDQSSYTRNNYLLSEFTVQPLDIRIEAIIYAQERSFFVIPGNWFNMNSTDVPGNPNGRPRGTDARWPFFGQCLDTRITIDGAVTENLPASSSDANEWYSKWGRIPKHYGSTDVPTAHYNPIYDDGLSFVYDDTLGWPVVVTGGSAKPIRVDKYGRALPITPCLPVCESLYYYGEPT